MKKEEITKKNNAELPSAEDILHLLRPVALAIKNDKSITGLVINNALTTLLETANDLYPNKITVHGKISEVGITIRNFLIAELGTVISNKPNEAAILLEFQKNEILNEELEKAKKDLQDHSLDLGYYTYEIVDDKFNYKPINSNFVLELFVHTAHLLRDAIIHSDIKKEDQHLKQIVNPKEIETIAINDDPDLDEDNWPDVDYTDEYENTDVSDLESTNPDEDIAVERMKDDI